MQGGKHQNAEFIGVTLLCVYHTYFSLLQHVQQGDQSVHSGIGRTWI